MKRRQFVGAIPLLCASSAVFAQTIAKIETSSPGASGALVPGFFSAPQLAALRRLSDIILPSIARVPGAIDARVPEFLDFLAGQSPLEVKALYRSGLDSLNTKAAAKFGRAFAGLENTQADELLGPLREAWTYREPADPYARFLRHAKADILTATTNSREWLTASQRTGNGTYWLAPE